MSYFDPYFFDKFGKMYSFRPPFLALCSVSSQQAVLSIPYIQNPTENTQFRADSRFALSQWETSVQSNAFSHLLGRSLESALQFTCVGPVPERLTNFPQDKMATIM